MNQAVGAVEQGDIATPKGIMAPLLVAVLGLLAFWGAAVVLLPGLVLDLGSLNFPTPKYALLAQLWTMCGGLSVASLAMALQRFRITRAAQATIQRLRDATDIQFMTFACSMAVLIPLLLRTFVLRGSPLTDDEGAYRFAARLLAEGHLWVASPPLKLFFDQNFMINDGRLYPVYFLGWPALLAPGVLLGIPGLVNAFLSAMTIPPLVWTLEVLVDKRWAKLGALLFLSAPFIEVAAATELSHTACLMSLCWVVLMYLRIRADRSRMASRVAFACWFALAFTIRPQSTLAIGLPLILWSIQDAVSFREARWRAILAYAAPSLLFAAAFLCSLDLQNGSPFSIGYHRYGEYMVQNKYRFTTFTAEDLTAVAGFDFSHVLEALKRTAAAGLLRLNFDLFGWPSSFVFLLLGGRLVSRGARMFWWMLASYLALMFFQRDWGVDTFGPLHAFEMSLPVLVLTTCAGVAMEMRPIPIMAYPNRGIAFSPSDLLLASIAMAWLGFVPIRIHNLCLIATQIGRPALAVEAVNLHRAVVFAPFPFTPECPGVPLHFVHFHPVNSPDFQDDILWVNHVDLLKDRQLLSSLGRDEGYFMRWVHPCDVQLIRLSEVTPEQAPPARMRFH